jgi:DNA helicase-2/ATP-dependent DNA helicase PcrA
VDRHDRDADALTLMTLHTAKGLEFPVVFITGMEDGLFPLSRVFDEPADLEEERRLFYVGITRAERKLFLTYARTRRRAGEFTLCKPSSFLDPIPDHLLEQRSTPSVVRSQRDGSTGWRSPAGRGSAGYGRVDDPGVHIDYSDSQDLPRFVKGERVRHAQFGSGVIRELSGFGRDLRVVIDFDSVGRKKVIARYANLQKEF